MMDTMTLKMRGFSPRLLKAELFRSMVLKGILMPPPNVIPGVLLALETFTSYSGSGFTGSSGGIGGSR